MSHTISGAQLTAAYLESLKPENLVATVKLKNFEIDYINAALAIANKDETEREKHFRRGAIVTYLRGAKP